MALTHTILAVLSHSPCSGYDISKQFEMGVGCYWKASQQQIYRELGKMESQGWVAFETVPQAGKPDKKIYRLTPSGQAELQRWYEQPTEPTAIREDLLVKVFAAPFFPTELLVKELLYRRRMHQEQLMKYREMEAEHLSQESPALVDQYRYLTLRRGIRYEQDWLDWCDEVLEFVKQREQQEGGIRE